MPSRPVPAVFVVTALALSACGEAQPASATSPVSPASSDALDGGGASPGRDAAARSPAPLPPFAGGRATHPSPAPPATDATAALDHTRCGWIGAGDDAGAAQFAANAAWFEWVHPDWYVMEADGVSLRALQGADSPVVLNAAAANGVRVAPMVVGADGDVPVSAMEAMLADPTLRAQHVQNLVAIAVGHGYAGLDMDYEHMWTSADRPGYTAFIDELSTAMHAAGKEVSIAVPALTDQSGTDNAWDYAALSSVLDVLHVMGYDFHTIGTHAGPTAPVGWIDAVGAFAAATGRPERFLLGLPNYGVTPSWYCNLSDCAATCGATFATTTDHMATCSYGHWTAGRALNCQSPNGQLFYDDTASLEEKVQTARAHGLRGVTYWTIGGEPPGFFDMVREYY